MEKRKIAIFLSLFWLIGLSTCFSFPPKLKLKEGQEWQKSAIHELSSPQTHLLLSQEKPQAPSFEVDWRLWGRLNSSWPSEALRQSFPTTIPAFFKKPRPLFDVKVTFIHFFHTW